MPEPARRRPAGKTTSRRDLLRINLNRSTPEELAQAVQALLEHANAPAEERVDLLARALVVEALRPYWTGSRSPQQAHEALLATDPELAAIIEAIAPMLLGRTEVREHAGAAIASIEALLGLDAPPEPAAE
ncbi:MAG: hypothetical protein M0R73_11020 [Dehalococcoidia bacterium]|nr:hypothetical protein [Dehalococcoidia bacterium]